MADDKIDAGLPPVYEPPLPNQPQTQPQQQFQTQPQYQSQPQYQTQPQPTVYYGQPQAASNTVMVGQPNPAVTIIQQPQVIRPANYLALAVVTTIFCNLLFGVIAIIFSVMSSSSADEGDLEGARTKGKVSLAMSLIGIFSSIIIVIIVVIYVVVVASTAASTLSSSYYSYGSGSSSSSSSTFCYGGYCY